MGNVKDRNKERYAEYQENTDKFHDNFKASGYSSKSGWRLRRSLLDHMVQYIDLPALDILDMGCNNGLTGNELCNALNRKNIETNIDGIDFVESALEIAKNSFNYRITIVSDITDKESIVEALGDRTYPLVHCCEVFHYIDPEDYNEFFSTVHSLLNPEGYFLLVMPNVRSGVHKIVKTLKPDVFDASFKYDYDVPFIKSIFNQFGLNIVSIYGADILTNLKINLERYSALKSLFSYEIAVLAQKA